MSKQKLTAKQKKFCDEYIISGNGSEAARKAGYKQPGIQANENLKKHNIQKYIERRMKKHEKKSIATASEVLEILTKMIRGEEVEEVFVGKKKRKKQITPKDRLKAAELLGKRYGIYTEKTEATVVAKVHNYDADHIINDMFGIKEEENEDAK